MKKVKMLAVALLFAGLGQLAGAQEAAHSDRQPRTRNPLRIAVQDICPVSGQKLGAMGTPVMVELGQQKEQVFLCCRGCANKTVDPGHWATIHANIAGAQAKCPVMGRPLPKNAKWTIVEGHVVYICCPPCAKKIEADPKTYLQKVDEFYAASLEARKTSGS